MTHNGIDQRQTEFPFSFLFHKPGTVKTEFTQDSLLPTPGSSDFPWCQFTQMPSTGTLHSLHALSSASLTTSPHTLGPPSQRLIIYEQQGEKSLGLYETIHFTHTSAGSSHRKSLTDTRLILSMLKQQNTDCLWQVTGHIFWLLLNHPSALSATHSHTHIKLVQFQ